jgi:4-hydroxy-4-methyl-2-oxoglutarate aldolase
VTAQFIGNVYQTPAGLDDDIARRARSAGVATLAAAAGEPLGRNSLVRAGHLTRVAGQTGVAGRAVTVWNPPGNNSMIRFGVEACEAGDILVISTPADGAAQWGELAHEWAKAVGIAAVIVDGSVRDIHRVREVGVPLWGRTVDPRQALKDSAGYVNAPVVIGGVRLCPGDLVVADDDAVMLIDARRAGDFVTLAEQRAERENSRREDHRSGRAAQSMAGHFSSGRVTMKPGTWLDDDPDADAST